MCASPLDREATRAGENYHDVQTAAKSAHSEAVAGMAVTLLALFYRPLEQARRAADVCQTYR